jgi:hypothetical protein
MVYGNVGTNTGTAQVNSHMYYLRIINKCDAYGWEERCIEIWVVKSDTRDQLEDLRHSWRTFLRACAKLSIKFEEILSYCHRQLEDQNRFWEPFIIIINYWIIIIIIIIIGAHYNYIIWIIRNIIIVLDT